MSRNVAELESILAEVLAEHRRLIAHLDAQVAAMKQLDASAMNDITNRQEALRLRVASLELRRRAVTDRIARELRAQPPLTLSRLAQLYPPRAEALLGLRSELQAVVGEVRSRTRIGGKLAGAVLGHLNTVVRLVSGVAERAGLYTKQGVPKSSSRIGVIEAVG